VQEGGQLYCSKFHIQPLYIGMHCSDYDALNEVLHVIRINVMFKLQFSSLVTWDANWYDAGVRQVNVLWISMVTVFVTEHHVFVQLML